MAIRVLQLGTKRLPGEGLRIGTVRRPPRGVPKSEFASRNYYDVWLPGLSPSPDTVKLGLSAATDRDWAKFEKRYRAEMARPEASRLLELLAALSHQTDFSVGCYCDNEARCHRSILRTLLEEKNAEIVPCKQ
jgi:uncharacterized protein YeaO (DUF488 family)